MTTVVCDKCGRGLPVIPVHSLGFDINGIGGFRMDVCEDHLADVVIGQAKDVDNAPLNALIASQVFLTDAAKKIPGVAEKIGVANAVV